jgi:phage gp29-like protein
MPPKADAPPPYPPISTSETQRALSPWPLIDRYPTVIGQSLTFNYLANTFRLATTGYRQQYVDLLNELIEQDPHLSSVVQKRILSTANGRIDVVPFDVPEDDKTNHDLAQKCAQMVQSELGRIPDLAQRGAELLWGLYYGISAAEIFWTRDSDGWHIERFGFVHSRRLSYPNYQSWDLFIWDQGQVYGWQAPYTSPTNSNLFGLRIADWPGKYVVYTPQLRGDYPTRDGIGRQTSTFATAKRIGIRGSMEYLERFAKPMMDTSWVTRQEGPDGTQSLTPRNATKEDIELAKQLAVIGPGSGSYAAHPDSVKVEPKSPDGSSTPKITFAEFTTICNGEMSKAALGGTLGTEVGSTGGNRSLGEVQERGEADLEQYDANVLGQCLRRDVVTWLVRLNMPEALHLVPHLNIHVETDPDPKFLIECAHKMTDIGAPVDLDKLAEEVGIPLVPNESEDGKETKPRRSFKSDVIDPSLVDETLKSDEAKQREEDDKANDLALEKHKATMQAQTAQAQATAQPKAAAGAKKTAKKAAKKSVRASDILLAEAGPFPPAPRPTGWQRVVEDYLVACKSGGPPKRNAAEVSKEIFRQMAEDFPAEAIDWIHDYPAQGPVEVDVSDIDYDNAKKWKASKEPDRVGFFERKIIDGEAVKPLVLVKRPGKRSLMIVDGHHRGLAYRRAEFKKALAYVIKVPEVNGPWDITHDQQRERTSG